MVHRKTKWASCILPALAVAMASAAPASAEDINIRLESASDTYAPGDTITVDILATTSSLLIGYGFDLVVPSEVIYTGYTTGEGFTGVAETPDGDGIAGLSFTGGVDGVDFSLGTATFEAVSEGSVLINIATSAGDLTEGFAQFSSGFFDAIVDPVTFDIIDTSNTNTPPASGGGGGPVVPEPATAMMIAVGAMAAIRRR